MKRCVLASLVLLAGSASADTVTATFNSVNPGSNGQFSLDGGANWGGTGPAGHFNWTRTGGDYAGLQGSFMSFCCELTEHIGYGGSYTYNVVALENGTDSIGGMGAARADEIRELFGRYYSPSFGQVLDADHAAAIQMSIWEIVYEQGATLSVSSGSARFLNDSATALSLADAMLASLDGTGPKANDLVAISAPGVQDQIVPAPGTLVLAGAGALSISRRRRQK